MPSSISTFCWVGAFIVDIERTTAISSVPSSTNGNTARRHALPMRPENTLEPLRMKSPSSPWPLLRAGRMPGQPAPAPLSLRQPGPGEIEIGHDFVHGPGQHSAQKVIGE